MPANTAQTKRFLGLNNVSDPLRLKFGWLQKADNIDISDTGAIVRRSGYAKSVDGVPSGAYATADLERLYLVDAGTLKQVHSPTSVVTLKTGLSTRPMYWTEINNEVYFNNGVDSGIIQKDGTVLAWGWDAPAPVTLHPVTGALPAGTYQVVRTQMLDGGRETGASDAVTIYLDGTQALQIEGLMMDDLVYIAPADSTVFQFAFTAGGYAMTWNHGPDELGMDLNTQSLDPLPRGCDYIAVWRSQFYAAMYMHENDSTVVWISEPLGFHLFDMSKSFVLLPGRVTMLAAHKDGLIVGTDSKVYVYTGEKLDPVADYGVVPGWGAVKDDDENGTIYFWSKRGMCSALPFSNITLRQISVDCGLTAGAAIIQQNGAKRYVVALQQGGDNFNERGTP